MKIIEITVDSKGQTKVETRGFTGGECREASRFVEQALGQRTDEKLTSEFYQGQTPISNSSSPLIASRFITPQSHLVHQYQEGDHS